MAASTISLAMNCIELARGNSPLSPLDKMRVITVIGDPLRDLLLVGQARVAAIHLAPDPAVAIAPEAFPEAAVIPCRVAANRPEDLSLLIS